ncbi:MAG: 1-(5-phosphoribosyl)-5-[(5-phosphoribosylamino)methylideneamino]imidazole-4-carboxamide isomerase [Candidatus Omnitrophica bacterium]|jgi:phosphoribosylformimino-5-aminoimidazole carboxamide ribotide isomerase|nr:1-(5-phosphoribosyl)-5-[(5-phosphoribosylamino)methylideneamino]imidazole-4-carboxamide isomerase [Candidatus Omnitrophota bacterium]MDD5526880.1 1-(5-phosphoribosyl)-5-[(5-phosphoribosylamino)methylideneamino]imidazole-4-carboxamide isomerase [Candidatus Omnitrophota bacterium]
MVDIFPAIDLQGGRVVRLVKGEFCRSKEYSRDAVAVAVEWAAQGARMIHVVDLDGAKSGKQSNLPLASKIAGAAGIPVQLGGGIRTLQAVKRVLDAGISRAILGTRAVEDRVFLEKAYGKFGERVIISLDAANGRIMVKGWMESHSGLDASDFARSLKRIGFSEMIYTDTLRDGTLKGPNVPAVRKLLKESGMRVIASGGISSLWDIKELCGLEEKGLSGIITGKAIYEKKFTLRQAIRAAGGRFYR